MQYLIDLTMMFKSCPNSKGKIQKIQKNKQKREKKTFEGLLSLVFGKRVALNDDAQLEVRMLGFFIFLFFQYKCGTLHDLPHAHDRRPGIRDKSKVFCAPCSFKL